MESTPSVLSFRMVFFCLVTTGWIVDIGLLCKNSDIKKQYNVGLLPDIILLTLCDYIGDPLQSMVTPKVPFDCLKCLDAVSFFFVFKNALPQHRGRPLPVQRRCSTHHLKPIRQ